MQTKKLVLLAVEGFSTRVVYNALSREFPVDKVIIENPVPRLKFLQRRAKKLGLIKVIGQIFFQAGIVPFLKKGSQGRVDEIKSRFDLDDSEIDPSRIIKVESVNSEQTADILKGLDPKLVVVNGTRIISKNILQCVSARFVNMHAGITPMYRGVHGGYWSLVEGKPETCGVTVHLVDPGIDTGNILGQALISPQEKDNFVTYPALQLAAGLPLMFRAVMNGLED
ncbi:MAG: formyl transferase, partial [Nitrospina sp.]|nr:formyl transferase [Nitrospina sp.]